MAGQASLRCTAIRVMIPDTVLDLAVTKGLIEPGQATALRSLARQEQPDAPRPEPVDEERLRFISGFADIFVTIGLVLFLGAASYLLHNYLGRAFVAAATAALAWALAEFFTRRRRMALPSIVLLVVFAHASFFALGLALGAGQGSGSARFSWLETLWHPQGDPLPMALGALGTVALAGLHYWRFRVPITVAAGAAALALSIVFALSAVAPDLTGRLFNGLLATLGLAVFAAAMWFDLRDPRRETRRTDIAFWLHLLAAPLIVHSVFQALGAGRGQVAIGVSALVLLVFAALALVAILVDRRALLVSGLVYAGVAFSSLIRGVGLTDTTTPVTILVLGAFVLLLSAGWAPLRAALLGFAPEGLAARLPRPLPS